MTEPTGQLAPVPAIGADIIGWINIGKRCQENRYVSRPTPRYHVIKIVALGAVVIAPFAQPLTVKTGRPRCAGRADRSRRTRYSPARSSRASCPRGSGSTGPGCTFGSRGTGGARCAFRTCRASGSGGTDPPPLFLSSSLTQA